MTERYRPMPSRLETDRLTLRSRVPADATWNLELLGERDGGTTLTLAEVEQRMAEQQVQAKKNGFGFLTMQRHADGDVIGYCGLLVGHASFDEPEIAYELFRRAHGQGYATEAARAVLEAAFATGRQRIWATVGAWNAPSLRVLEKIGFWPDHTVVDERGEVVYLVRDA
jgi:RimJ/RimL family protein N-acetyltransferase